MQRRRTLPPRIQAGIRTHADPPLAATNAARLDANAAHIDTHEAPALSLSLLFSRRRSAQMVSFVSSPRSDFSSIRCTTRTSLRILATTSLRVETSSASSCRVTGSPLALDLVSSRGGDCSGLGEEAGALMLADAPAPAETPAAANACVAGFGCLSVLVATGCSGAFLASSGAFLASSGAFLAIDCSGAFLDRACSGAFLGSGCSFLAPGLTGSTTFSCPFPSFPSFASAFPSFPWEALTPTPFIAASGVLFRVSGFSSLLGVSPNLEAFAPAPPKFSKVCLGSGAPLFELRSVSTCFLKLSSNSSSSSASSSSSSSSSCSSISSSESSSISRNFVSSASDFTIHQFVLFCSASRI
mmetsp:Transcript_39408/g.93291  ORF Transcript_39408/g.93291 Transcript_39408/m.93291 type:complete len:356 (-) Transcript_39408:403-1470(-)